MRIGSNYDKIEWKVFNLNLLEPITFFGDLIIAGFCFYFAYKLLKMNTKVRFFYYWRWFFITFGISMIVGSFGHLLYNYTGAFGKWFGWLGSLITSIFLEMAFISIYPNTKIKKILYVISYVKLALMFIIELLILSFADIDKNQALGLIVPSINFFIGIGFCAGYLGYYYQKTISENFKYFWIGVLVLVPTTILQLLKINPHQYFDRNDLSHLILILSLILFYQGLKKLSKIDFAKSLD
jgi:hypothetical protein